MMKLRSITKSPPGGRGFEFIDQTTSWRTHSWSFNQTMVAWYQENVKRGTGRTKEQCAADVEAYMCEQLMKTDYWKDWVLVNLPPTVGIVSSITTVAPVESKVSVIIPVYKSDPDRLKRCLESALPQAQEVIIVTDDPVLLEQPSPKVRIVTTGQVDTGFSFKCNLGANTATGDYFWFLNDDCYPNSGCANALLEIMSVDQKAGIVGHLLRYPDGMIQHGGTCRQSGKVGFPHIDVGLTEASVKLPTETEAVTAASIMVRREAFVAVGGFSEDYFLYLEDSDLCLKMWAAGWKVFYTPLAEAIHEEHKSSVQRSDLSEIISESVSTFTGKWSGYLSQPPPQFKPIDLSAMVENIDVLYVHLVGDRNHNEMASAFIDSALRFPPGRNINWVIACNSQNGSVLSQHMREVFSRLGKVQYFSHDNTGWDVGAFQAYARTSKAKFILFLGSSAYCRRPRWILPMIEAFDKFGPDALYGSCGNLGDANSNVSPHIRTTGFWCAPSVLNRYPTIVRDPHQRYPFEHGPNCLTMWSWGQGFQVLAVDADGIYGYPRWNDGPNGFHRGNQSALLIGDRITAPPYHPNP